MNIHEICTQGITALLCILIIGGCANSDVVLVERNAVRYPDFSFRDSYTSFFIEDQKAFLANMSWKTNVLSIADAQSGKVVDTIQLKKTYTNRHWYERYFYAHKRDSMFFFGSSSTAGDLDLIMLINGEGELINLWNLDTIYTTSLAYAIQPSTNSPAMYYRNRLHLQKVIKTLNYSKTEERKEALKYPTELIIDLTKTPPTCSNSIGSYPEHYFENNYRDIFFSRCLTVEGHVVASHAASHFITVYHDDNEEKYDASSDYIQSFNPINEHAVNMDLAISKFFHEEPKYVKIIRDPFRNQYLRLAYHRTPASKKDGTTTGFLDIQKSIVLLDHDFLKLGEVKLNSKTFADVLGFTNDGLLMMEIRNGKRMLVTYDIRKD